MAAPNAVYMYLNTLYPTVQWPFVGHGSIWTVMQRNVILIASIKTLIAFYLSFKAQFPQLRFKPQTSSYRTAEMQLNEEPFSSPLPGAHIIGINARKQAGSAKEVRSL